MVDELKQVLKGESLSREQAAHLMSEILSGSLAPEQIGAFLIALQCKSEAIAEIVGFVDTLRGQCRVVETGRDDLIDTCGTGGDGSGTFNVSTTVAFVVAGAGQPIAKHGNRAISSRSGSFDVLEQLGIGFGSDTIATEPQQVRRSIEEFGLGFMFAPAFHPTLKSLAQLRRNIGVRTVFNLLGPLLNPAGVKRQLVGVYDAGLVEKVAFVLRDLGAVEAMVVRGEDGLDELTLCGPTRVAHLKNGNVKVSMVLPEDCGLKSARAEEMAGGDAKDNARILTAILDGEKGEPRDLVLLNSGAALLIGGRAQDLKEGVERAAESIDSGKAKRVLLRIQKDAQSTQPQLGKTGT